MRALKCAVSVFQESWDTQGTSPLQTRTQLSRGGTLRWEVNKVSEALSLYKGGEPQQWLSSCGTKCPKCFWMCWLACVDQLSQHEAFSPFFPALVRGITPEAQSFPVPFLRAAGAIQLC